MKASIILAAAAAALTLGACSEPSAQPTPVETPVAAAEPIKPALPAPDQEIFSTAFAAACPAAKKVAVASCRSMGLGETDFRCDYGLGEDEHLRHNAIVTPVDDEWTIADPETTCAQGA